VLPRLLPWLAVALAVLVFAGALSYQFADDDYVLFVTNPSMQSWDYLGQYFTHSVWHWPGHKDPRSNFYRPLLLAWLRLNYQFFGQNPAGYHATAIALHALVTLLAYGLAVRTLHDRIAAGFAAILFAVHPVHVEAVASICQANEPECEVFFLAALLCFLRWRENENLRFATYDLRPGTEKTAVPGARSGSLGIANRKSPIVNRKWFLLSLAAYALALLTKETAVALCAMFFFYELHAARNKQPATGDKLQATSQQPDTNPVASAEPAAHSLGHGAWSLKPGTLGRKLLRAAWVTLPYVLLIALYLLARAFALGGLAPDAGNRTPWRTTLFSLPAVFCFDMRKLVWPLPTSLIYPLRLITHPTWGNFAGPLLISLAVLAALWYWSRRSEAAGAASVWLFLPLAMPLFGISHFRPYDLVHDRFLYLPSLGMVMLAALALRHLNPGGRKCGGVPAAQAGAVLALGCVFGGLCVQQSRYWRNSMALYRHAVEVAPRNPLGLGLLANRLAEERRDFEGAHQLAERALAEEPDDYAALRNAGTFRKDVKDIEGAVAAFQRARQLEPDERDPHFWLAVLYLDRGQFADAEAEFREVNRLAPNEPWSHYFQGVLFEAEGRLAEARKEYQAELQISPHAAHATKRLAAVEEKLAGQDGSRLPAMKSLPR
jgi:Tfp pilus assembly protein PilF